MLSNITIVMWLIIILGILMQLASLTLPEFLARKVKHVCAGITALLLPANPAPTAYRVGVVVFCCLVVFVESYQKYKRTFFDNSESLSTAKLVVSSLDLGILFFAIVICVCYLLEVPMSILAVVFFADPAAAVAGRFLTDAVDERQSKTVSSNPAQRNSSQTQLTGSFTFWLVAIPVVCAFWGRDLLRATIIGATLTIVEHISPEGTDNLTVAVMSYIMALLSA